ncbi:hypothetical protein [Thermococcus sp. MAR1]|uniref:hypothetical protein n=1 Tax=Thermococcus sp. MAR1 TaxID=1638263 RepID=UPI00143BAB64|nr:hypothetical protein [Thermococcus sp. MAR1]NJE09398.1 hypothetical protein [Thermococcus sp. MAR1]
MRTFGWILVFLGLLLLMREFQPSFLDWLRPYAPYIRDAFWGVTLIAFGLYMLTRRALRRAVLILYLIYLLLYLVV